VHRRCKRYDLEIALLIGTVGEVAPFICLYANTHRHAFGCLVACHIL
jgi:hypothetical protein